MPQEVVILREVEKDSISNCPALRKTGENWYFCGVNLPETLDTTHPSSEHPAYRAHKGLPELQIWCMGDYERCIKFNENPLYTLD